MDNYSFSELYETLPSRRSAVLQSMNGEALGMLSAQAGAVAESSDDEDEKNPNGLQASLIKDNDYKNAVHNLASCEKDIKDLEDSISDDMDTDKRRKVLAKLADKKDYLKVLRAKLKLAEVKAREKIKDEKVKASTKEQEKKDEADEDKNVNESVGTIRKVIDVKMSQLDSNIRSAPYRKDPRYKKLDDQSHKIMTQLNILQDKIDTLILRGEFEKAANLKAEERKLATTEQNISVQLIALTKELDPNIPVSYWKSEYKLQEKLVKQTEKRIEKMTAACNSIGAQHNPEVKSECNKRLDAEKKTLGLVRHRLDDLQKKIDSFSKKSAPVKESVYDDYMVEANIIQKAAIKADTLVNKTVMKDYRKDANYKAIDDSINELNEKIREMDIDITRLESKDKSEEAESVRVQQQKLMTQQDKLMDKETELRLKVEDTFPKSYWRKEMEKQRKRIEKLQSKHDRCERHLQFIEKQDAPELIKQYQDIIKERKTTLDEAKKLYDRTMEKYNAAEDK